MKYSTPVLDTPASKKKSRVPPKAPGGPPSRPEHPVRLRPGRPGLFHKLRRNRTAYGACAILALIGVGCAAAPLLSPYPVGLIEPGLANLAPSLEHPFGTDDLGRDVFVRVLYGGRLSLCVGLFAALFALALGVAAGGAAGYAGGLVDAVVMRAVDAVLSIPAFFVVLFLSGLISPGLLVICLLIGLVQWPEVARVVRAVVRSMKACDFIEAARALGAPDRQVIARHILPHTTGPLAVTTTLGVAHAIMMESALSFLGFGMQSEVESWGAMMQHAQAALSTAPWLAVFPGLMIFLTVACCYVLGDFLRRELSPERTPLH